MNKIVIVIISIIMSASAQVILKITSRFDFRSFYYFMFLGFAVCCYFISFVGYSLALRSFELSRIGPLMAVAVMVLVVLVGALAFKEHFTQIKMLGLLLGAVSVFLLSVK